MIAIILALCLWHATAYADDTTRGNAEATKAVKGRYNSEMFIALVGNK